jgi:hypothetical protein
MTISSDSSTRFEKPGWLTSGWYRILAGRWLDSGIRGSSPDPLLQLLDQILGPDRLG